MKNKKTADSYHLNAYDVETTPVLDSEHLMQQCQNSLEIAYQCVSEFLSDTACDLDELDRALSCGDVARVASMAYRISNGAQAVGAKQTQVITKALEKSCRNGNYDSLPLHVSQFRHGCHRLEDALSKMTSER
jgi:HPt (histidine-containing phosphotransfer) domain-containing protein